MGQSNYDIYGTEYGIIRKRTRACADSRWFVQALHLLNVAAFPRLLAMATEKTVLVHLGERVRPVKFQGTQDGLVLAVRAAFHDMPGLADMTMILQVGIFLKQVCLYF